MAGAALGSHLVTGCVGVLVSLDVPVLDVSAPEAPPPLDSPPDAVPVLEVLPLELPAIGALPAEPPLGGAPTPVMPPGEASPPAPVAPPKEPFGGAVPGFVPPAGVPGLPPIAPAPSPPLPTEPEVSSVLDELEQASKPKAVPASHERENEERRGRRLSDDMRLTLPSVGVERKPNRHGLAPHEPTYMSEILLKRGHFARLPVLNAEPIRLQA